MTETGKPKDWPSGIVWGSPKREVDWANVRQLHEADMERSRKADDMKSLIKPGVQVEIMERGEWVGPYTVTDGVGRTPEHLVLRGTQGKFEHYNDAPYNTRIVSE